MHGNFVAVVLNSNMVRFFSQYHCVFDDRFHTVSHMSNVTVSSNWVNLVEPSYEEVLSKRFSVCNTCMTQYQPSNHTSRVQQYLDCLPSYDPIPDAPTGDLSGNLESVKITETFEHAITVV